MSGSHISLFIIKPLFLPAVQKSYWAIRDGVWYRFLHTVQSNSSLFVCNRCVHSRTERFRCGCVGITQRNVLGIRLEWSCLAWCRHNKPVRSSFLRVFKMSFNIVITGRNEVVAKVMFLLVSVILLTPQEDGYCCGRYASYWNAFLFFSMINFTEQHFLIL